MMAGAIWGEWSDDTVGNALSTKYEERINVPLEYGLCRVWFFSLAPLSILSVAHCSQDKLKNAVKKPV